MASKLTRFWLFLSSYLPLILICALLFRESQPIFATAAVLLSATSWVLMHFYLNRLGTLYQANQLNVVKARRKDADAVGYIVSYLLPFFISPKSDNTQLLAVLAVFFFLWLLYSNTNLMYVNPMLIAGGFRTFEIETADGAVFTLISKRRRVKPSDRLWVVELGEEVYVEKSEVKEALLIRGRRIPRSKQSISTPVGIGVRSTESSEPVLGLLEEGRIPVPETEYTTTAGEVVKADAQQKYLGQQGKVGETQPQVVSLRQRR